MSLCLLSGHGARGLTLAGSHASEATHMQHEGGADGSQEGADAVDERIGCINVGQDGWIDGRPHLVLRGALVGAQVVDALHGRGHG